jgi:hypothetical protein
MAIKEIILVEAGVLVFLVVALIVLFAVRSHNKAKQSLDHKNIWKLENWIIFFIYLAGGLFLVYILGSTYLQDMFEGINSGDYELNLKNPTNTLSALRFSKDIFGDVVDGSIMVENENIINLIFKPKLILEEGREATLILEGTNNGTEVYFDGKLIIPDLSGYSKAADFTDSEVWVRNDLLKNTHITKSSAESFVYFNYPGTKVYSFKELDKGVPILTDYRKEETRIDTTFRDNLKLAVYHGGGDLKVEFTKQDLNNYVGRDEYTLSVIDYTTGDVVYKEIFEDDGDKKDSRELGEENDFDFEIDLGRGIYYLDFKKDGNNPSSDSTLKDLKIGSNKVLIVGNSLVYEANSEFFIKANAEKEIIFKYWWSGKDQRIYFSGSDTFTKNIDEDWKSKDYVVTLEKGDYDFRIEKGFIWANGDAFSVGEDSWFDLPVESEEKIKDSNDILIIDENSFSIDENVITVEISFKIEGEESSYKFQALDIDMFSINNLEVRI